MADGTSDRDELRVLTPADQFICFESREKNPSGTSYIRFIDAGGEELAYWDSREWAEAPEEVMGAIMGALTEGANQHG